MDTVYVGKMEKALNSKPAHPNHRLLVYGTFGVFPARGAEAMGDLLRPAPSLWGSGGDSGFCPFTRLCGGRVTRRPSLWPFGEATWPSWEKPHCGACIVCEVTTTRMRRGPSDSGVFPTKLRPSGARNQMGTSLWGFPQP